VVGVGAWSLESPGPTASFELAADGNDSSITIEHVAGDAIDVEALSVTIAVDGTELDTQPPIPFVGAKGFDGAPDGPFNAKSDSTWTAGERAGVSIANNNPTLAAWRFGHGHAHHRWATGETPPRDDGDVTRGCDGRLITPVRDRSS